MLRKIGKALHRLKPSSQRPPHTVPASQFDLSPEKISPSALKTVAALTEAGFEAYVVGGCVRDLILGIKPKDFDVATNATPEETQRLFKRARIIGRRFQIVHVRFGREIVEVTTFRGHHTPKARDDATSSKRSRHGLLLRDNVFGSVHEDAARRDFTVNALYYDPNSNLIYDYTGGLTDLKTQTLRVIGDPAARYREDPVRILRALRFSARLGFHLESASGADIESGAALLDSIPAARLFDETLKLLMTGHGVDTWQYLHDHQLDHHLFPETARATAEDPSYGGFLRQALANTDARVNRGKHVTPAFLFAALLWPAVKQREVGLIKAGNPPGQAYLTAISETVSAQVKRIAIPKRFSIPMREIWEFQPRLQQRSGQRAFHLVGQPRFRAAYDFLLLREQSGEDCQGLGAWWTAFQEADEDTRNDMVARIKRKRRPRRRPRKRAPAPHAN